MSDVGWKCNFNRTSTILKRVGHTAGQRCRAARAAGTFARLFSFRFAVFLDNLGTRSKKFPKDQSIESEQQTGKRV